MVVTTYPQPWRWGGLSEIDYSSPGKFTTIVTQVGVNMV